MPARLTAALKQIEESTSDEASSSAPSIFTFHDYRLFLKQYLAWLDAQPGKENFSIRATSIRAGFSESYLPLVVRGHRNLTSKAQDALLAILKLDAQEKAFFRCLVQLADSDRNEEKQRALEAMTRLSDYRHENHAEAHLYLRHWYHVVIREMAELPGFRLDPYWIRKKLKNKIPISKIKEALAYLVQNKIIQFDKKGQIKTQQPLLDCNGGIFKIALNEFHRQMFDLAIKANDVTARDERLIDAITIPISNEEIPEIKQILSQAIKQVVQLVNKERNDSHKRDVVYHIAFTGFPTTEAAKKKPVGEDEL